MSKTPVLSKIHDDPPHPIFPARRPPAFLAMLAIALPAALASAQEPSPQRADQLGHMLRHDCGSCHGMTFKGGLGPPLTPDALRDKSPEALADAIRLGRPAGAMPPWGPLLSEPEIQWMVHRLRQGDAP